jgi:hypothetical protein
VWRYGYGAVSLLGKTASPTQIDILARTLNGRPLVLVPDQNDPESLTAFADTGAKVNEAQQTLGLSVSDLALALVPEDLDPAKLSRQSLHHLVAAAAADPVRSGPLRTPGEFPCSTEQVSTSLTPP